MTIERHARRLSRRCARPASPSCRASRRARNFRASLHVRSLEMPATVAVMAEPETDARRIATEARDRVRFEEDALELSDQVYRVARHLAGSREEAEDLMQE